MIRKKKSIKRYQQYLVGFGECVLNNFSEAQNKFIKCMGLNKTEVRCK